LPDRNNRGGDEMSACEKCWGDAYMLSMRNGRAQHENYSRLLEERKDNPCSPKDQAGQFWDEEKQCDKRHGE